MSLLNSPTSRRLRVCSPDACLWRHLRPRSAHSFACLLARTPLACHRSTAQRTPCRWPSPIQASRPEPVRQLCYRASMNLAPCRCSFPARPTTTSTGLSVLSRYYSYVDAPRGCVCHLRHRPDPPAQQLTPAKCGVDLTAEAVSLHYAIAALRSGAVTARVHARPKRAPLDRLCRCLARGGRLPRRRRGDRHCRPARAEPDLPAIEGDLYPQRLIRSSPSLPLHRYLTTFPAPVRPSSTTRQLPIRAWWRRTRPTRTR